MANSNNNDDLDKTFTKIFCGPIHLGEAGYFKNLLDQNGIAAQIQPNEIKNKNQQRQPIFCVMVRLDDLNKAKEICGQELLRSSTDEADISKHKNKKSRFNKAVFAGLLGLAMGARVGVKLKHHPVFIMLFVICLGLVGFCGVWYFWPEGPK